MDRRRKLYLETVDYVGWGGLDRRRLASSDEIPSGGRLPRSLPLLAVVGVSTVATLGCLFAIVLIVMFTRRPPDAVESAREFWLEWMVPSYVVPAAAVVGSFAVLVCLIAVSGRGKRK